MLHISTLVPAYGRDYKSKAEVLADWNADKDFIETNSTKPINKSQIDSLSITTVTIRYAKLRKVTALQLRESGQWS